MKIKLKKSLHMAKKYLQFTAKIQFETCMKLAKNLV